MTPADHEHLCTQTQCAFPNEPYCRPSGGSKAATPEPELNVEAVRHQIGKLRRSRDAHQMDESDYVEAILALIQQVSDQKVEGFAEDVKNHLMIRSDEVGQIAHKTNAAIDQALADYLSHKEARDAGA